MERISQRKFWFFLIIISGLLALWVGKKWLFANAACLRLQDVLLYGSTAVIVLIGLLYVLITPNDSPVNMLVSIVVVFGAALLLSGVAGPILGKRQDVQMVFCPRICEKAADAEHLREQGELDGAEGVARDCIANTTGGLLPQECAGSCDVELSKILFAKAGVTIDSSLTGAWTEAWKPACEQAGAQLAEARSLAVAHNEQTLVDAIDERQLRLIDKCTIQPTPIIVKIEVLRKQVGVEDALLDVRVLENNEYQANLQLSDFSLKVNGVPIAFNLEQRKADASVCMMAVVDNSGSISPGLQSIRNAINKLNEFRKPGDEFGLITFGPRADVKVQQSPASEPLDPNKVNGSGRLTALWDGINLGLDTVKSCQTETRYLLVLTDGIDNDSSYMSGSFPVEIADSLAGKAAEQNTDICVVGVSENVDATALGEVAHGCSYFHADDFEGVVAQFQSILGYVTDFYRITFPLGELTAQQSVTLQVPGSGEVTVDFANP